MQPSPGSGSTMLPSSMSCVTVFTLFNRRLMVLEILCRAFLSVFRSVTSARVATLDVMFLKASAIVLPFYILHTASSSSQSSESTSSSFKALSMHANEIFPLRIEASSGSALHSEQKSSSNTAQAPGAVAGGAEGSGCSTIAATFKPLRIFHSSDLPL